MNRPIFVDVEMWTITDAVENPGGVLESALSDNRSLFDFCFFLNVRRAFKGNLVLKYRYGSCLHQKF